MVCALERRAKSHAAHDRISLVARRHRDGDAPAAADDVTIRNHLSDDTLLRIGPFAFAGGKTLNLTVGIGSSAFRRPDDPANVLWTLGDRGPNIECKDMKEIAGVELGCQRDQEQPRLSDAVLHAVDLSRAAARRRQLPRHRRHHAEGPRRPPAQRHAAAAPHRHHRDAARRPAASELKQSLRGIDAEALVRLADGTFWVGEENAPSLAHFSADGRMIERHVPAGTEGDFAGAPYDDQRHAAGDHRQAPGQPRHRGHRDLARRALPLFHHAEPAGQPGQRHLRAGPQHPAVQARPRDHEGGRRIRLHPRRPAELPPRSFEEAERSAHQRADGDRPRPADRRRAHRADHQALRDRACRRDQHRGLALGRRGDAADAWSRPSLPPRKSRR